MRPGKSTLRFSHGEKRFAHFRPLRVEDVAQAVAEQVEAERDDEDREPRHRRHPPLVDEEAPAAGDHRAPFRRGRLGAEAEEAEAGGRQDDARHVERHADDDGGEAERHDVAPDDPRRRCALQGRRGDEVGVADRQRLGPGDARIGRPRGDGDGDDGILDARAEGRDEGERQHEARKGEEDVGDAHQHRIEPAAEIARARADREADRRRDDRDEADDEKRQARAEDDAAEDVARLLVGAEPVDGRRRQQALGPQVAAGDRRIGGDEVGEERHDDQQHDDERADHRQPVLEEGGPDAVGLAGARLQARLRIVGQQPGAARPGGHSESLTRGSSSL